MEIPFSLTAALQPPSPRIRAKNLGLCGRCLCTVVYILSYKSVQ
jgi:hypothetical protein